MKKFYKFHVFFLIIFGIFPLFTQASELTNSQKGAILEKFTEKQYDLLFKSDLLNFSSEYSGVFSMSNQIDIYGVLQSDTEKEKEKEDIQKKREALIKTISSLEESITTLDNDIADGDKTISNINKDIIKIKLEIDTNTKIIEELKKKIEENTQVLLEYLIYIYKKSNTAYNGVEIDNMKSILLNGESIGDLINDLYFQEIIQMTGKKIVDNHRKYMSELYLKKVGLEKQEQDLKTFRKQGIIEQKILQDKKKFKEELLKESKGQQTYYEKYLEQKLNLENEIKLKTIKEQLKLTTTRNRILEKYDCKYVDIIKNTIEARVMQIQNPKCYSINRIIISENQLVVQNSSGSKVSEANPLTWPVNPIEGITAFYKDKEYEEMFGAEHNAIDIKVPQGTPIEAPMDGYVIHITPPTSQDYSYVAIKHYDGFVSVYGHLSEVLIQEFDFLEKGQIFAKSGGEYGTFGAGYITTGPHLHFEVFKNAEYIDPLTVLDLSYIKDQKLPDKYDLKFELDFKNKNGYDYRQLSGNSKVFELKGSNEIERQEYLITNYAAPGFNDWQMWIDESLNGAIDPSFVMCIGLAESGLGKSLTTAYNVGNVGNNDRGDRREYRNPKEGIAAIVYALNNKYLMNYNKLAYLSGGGRAEAGLPACQSTPTEYCYATSLSHWHNNMKRCLSHLKGIYILDSYNFRF